jgi:hypothetical protein
VYLQHTFDQPSIERARTAQARTAMNRPSELDQLLDQAP